jgi:hypothetical protein
MASNFRVMTECSDATLEIRDGDIDLSSVVQDSVIWGPFRWFSDLVEDFISSLIAFTTTSSWLLSLVCRQIFFRISPSLLSITRPSRAQMARKFGVSKTMLSLSPAPEPWSDLQLKASDLPMVLPGRWCMRKSNLPRSRDQQACLWFSFLAVMKYSRFLWSVQILTWCSTPSTKCLHSSKALTVASISLSCILQFHSISERDLDRNATGCHLSSSEPCWDRTAPVAESELSISIQKGFKLFGRARMGVEVIESTEGSLLN